MSINVAEILKLADMLDSANIPYESEELWGGIHIEYPNKENCVCSVICHDFSFGGHLGLLEIMGLTDDDDVQGYLTAQDVYNRIAIHYLSSGQISA